MKIASSALLLWVCNVVPAGAEDGYDLWLRYRPLDAEQIDTLRPHATQIVAAAEHPTQRSAREELARGLGGLLGQAPEFSSRVSRDEPSCSERRSRCP